MDVYGWLRPALFRLPADRAHDLAHLALRLPLPFRLLGPSARAGAGLREKLGVAAPSPSDSAGTKASLPATSEAARLYAEGLEKQRLYDFLGARELLEKAVGYSESRLAEFLAGLLNAFVIPRNLGIVTGPDGTVELCFEVAGELEITPWILTWGDTIEVVEPPTLRERLTSIALGMARRYVPSDTLQ